jgi:lipopolysaccharide export system permease protein
MSLSTKKKRGSSNINIYMVVLNKKPVSAFILTIIAVSVLQERRGGMGMNLTIGIIVATCVFDKIFGTLAENLLFTIVGSMVPLFSEY